MIAIVCVDQNWGIGIDNNLLFSIPDDMKFFVEKTKNNIIVCGRKTLYSFKNKNPLKNRFNIVFTRNNSIKNDYSEFNNIAFVNDKDDFLKLLISIKNGNSEYKDSEVFICGGESIYKLLLDDCTKIYVTKMDKNFKADSFFPNLDLNKNFKLVNKSESFVYEDINYQFLEYVNEKK